MLTRRHIRIKVLQALYGFHQLEEPDLKLALKEMDKSLDRIYELYLYELRIFTEMHRLAEERIEKNRQKFRPSQEDLNPNLKFVNNRILK
ncbi:MAG: antitermination protein NusB, partial [Flavobacteriia bacterium]|nr:antitermination protein NusB [Flavobacteriia bacterium]